MYNSVISRLFFALRPSPPLARRLAQMLASLDASPLLLERLHITMFVLDDASRLDPALAAAMIAVGDSVRSGPVAITLDRLATSARSIALRPSSTNAGLQALHAELARLAGAAGIAERRGHRFGAHMTLGHRDGAARKSLASRPVAPIEWTADELVLIRSHVGRARLELLGRWPLVGVPDAQLSLL